MSRKRILALAAAVCLAGIGGAVGYAVRARPKASKVVGYGRERAYVVGYQSGNLGDGHVMLAGDSHAELALPDPPSCGRRLLNAGVSGAKTDDYLAFLDRLSLKGRPSVVVVTLGTNHLLRKHYPASPETGDRYEADLAGIVERLSRMADRIVVAAVPPVSTSLDKQVDPAGVAALTKRQTAVCARLGCEAVDPYASYRSESFGIARPDATRDGLHLDEYATAYRAIDRQLCR